MEEEMPVYDDDNLETEEEMPIDEGDSLEIEEEMPVDEDEHGHLRRLKVSQYATAFCHILVMVESTIVLVLWYIQQVYAAEGHISQVRPKPQAAPLRTETRGPSPTTELLPIPGTLP